MMNFRRRSERQGWFLTCSTASITVAMLLTGQASAQSTPSQTNVALTDEQAAIIFGARENVLDASLSPDGSQIAVIEPYGARGMTLKITNLADPSATPVPILNASGDPERISWCRWSGQRRLLCNVYASIRLDTGDVTYVNRLYAVDADGKRSQYLRLPGTGRDKLGFSLFGGSVIDWNTGQDGYVLMMREYVPEVSTGTRNAQTKDGLGVDSVNTVDFKSGRVEQPRVTALEYISDGLGKVRIMGIDPKRSNEGYASGITRYLYRLKGKDGWDTLGDYESLSGTGFNPYYVDPTLDLAYGVKKRDGRYAAISVSLDGKATETTLLARQDVDIDGFATIGRNRRVVGVTYTTDRGEVAYFDPELKKIAIGLARGLKDLPLIRFVDSSQDESKLLLWAGSDVDPGHYYLFEKGTRALTELMLNRTPLLNRPLAAVKAIKVKVADGTEVPAYLTLPPGSDGKNLPTIVMPHGGPGARDEWGFDWLAQFWANRGYAVLQPNFRGSAGYGDTWFQNNGFQSWRTAIGDIDDSARWLVSQGIADPAKLAIFGWSYGGYAALQSAVTEPNLFKAVIAVAPVADLDLLKKESENWSNYRIERDFIGSGPHIEEGSPARQAEKIKAPVMLFHGNFDRNVSIRQSQLMADRLKDAGRPAKYVTYDKLDHYLEDSDARKDMLLKSVDFLRESFAAAK
jgi:dipeptidyl aminopeptidase/acylaminoacyl peptidase